MLRVDLHLHAHEFFLNVKSLPLIAFVRKFDRMSRLSTRLLLPAFKGGGKKIRCSSRIVEGALFKGYSEFHSPIQIPCHPLTKTSVPILARREFLPFPGKYQSAVGCRCLLRHCQPSVASCNCPTIRPVPPSLF